MSDKGTAQQTGTPIPQGLPGDKEQAVEKGNSTSEHAENGLKGLDLDDNGLPRADNVIEALGIPNWRELEKKAVRRLDLTLLPALWSLYLFNYLDRASLACVHLCPY